MLALVGVNDDQGPDVEAHQLDLAARQAYELLDDLEMHIQDDNTARRCVVILSLSSQTK